MIDSSIIIGLVSVGSSFFKQKLEDFNKKKIGGFFVSVLR